MEELDDKIVEREVEFTDDWYMVRKMDRTPTFAEAIHWADTHPNWVKVEDRLPENDGDILIYHYKPIYEEWELSIAFYDERLGEFWTIDGYKVHPTHWMAIVLPKED